MLEPDRYGRTVLAPKYVLFALTDSSVTTDDLKVLTAEAVLTNLQAVMQNSAIKDEDIPSILNQHFDLMQLIHQHHAKRFPEYVEESVAYLEAKRGIHLGQLAEADDATPQAKTEYAYWLLGQAEKNSASDTDIAKTFIEKAEIFLRAAHDSDHVEATEALATLLYVDKGLREEAIGYWEQAASRGDITAIQNLSAVVLGDDSFDDDERRQTLTHLWQGIVMKRAATRDIARSLKQMGYTAPSVPSTVQQIREPA